MLTWSIFVDQSNVAAFLFEQKYVFYKLHRDIYHTWPWV